MALFYLTKQPREETTFGVDQSGFREFQQGEKIASVDIECTQDGVPAVGIVISSSHTDDMVSVRITGGVDGLAYVISILATTDAGHVRESDVELMVRERP